MIDLIHKYDIRVLEFIQNNIHNTNGDKIFSFITFLGDKGLIWIIISLFLLLNKKNRKVGLMTLLALILATIMGEGLIKNIIQRSRPFVHYPSLDLVLSTITGYSFPSGHTTSSFAAAGVLAMKIKKYQIFFWVLAFSIAFSRLYLLVHYPSDILVGIMLGLLCSLVILKSFDFINSRKNTR